VARGLAGPFFKELVVRVPDAAARCDTAAADGLVPGFPLERWYPELRDTLLVCVTELHGDTQIERLVDVLAEPRRLPRSMQR
jgi:glycine dehydrogenase subunit 1